MAFKRLIIASNRLPVILKEDPPGQWQISPGTGGLVTAFAPVLRNRGGLWVGWPGSTDIDGDQLKALLKKGALDTGYLLEPLELTREEVERYYHGFANEILWPLFHDLPSRCNFDPAYWPSYQNVNRKMARVLADCTKESDYVWVQDYHLILTAQELEKMGVQREKGFFLHIPFPPLDLFLKLPWRFQILEALLDYDLIGFQTQRDRRNFFNCARTLIPGARVRGSGQVAVLSTREREVRVGAFPISIDYQEFHRAAASNDVAEWAWLIHEDLPNRQLILGVDRLDYTKGIPERIKAFGYALERYPELRRKVNLIQVVVPSRTDVQEYQALKQEIERLVGEVNGRFTQSGWTPVHYIYRLLSRTDLVAYYRTSEIALVTPLKDGMNLVAKEFCVCSMEENAVLILSEFAGAAVQLRHGAILVNPHDIEGMAEAIYRAYWMTKEERKDKMKKLRRSIQQQDIFKWVDSYLKAAIAKNLDDFPPPVDDYFVPQPDRTRDES